MIMQIEKKNAVFHDSVTQLKTSYLSAFISANTYLHLIWAPAVLN